MNIDQSWVDPSVTGNARGVIVLADEAISYHGLTAYSRDRHWLVPVRDERILRGFKACSAKRIPQHLKQYDPSLTRVSLPTSTGAVGTGPDATVTAWMLEASLGVRPAGRRDPAATFRAASSAGNRHPIEAYVCARNLPGLADGIWHYDPVPHQLVRVGPPPEGGDVSALVLTGVPWRTCWRYAERGYRHLWWDAGTALSHQLAVADHAGVRARVLVGFADDEVATLVGAEPPWEIPLVAVALGDGAPALVPSGPAAPGRLGPDHTLFPLIVDTHRAAELADEEAVRSWRRPEDTASTASTAALVPHIAGRRSARRLDPAGLVTAEQVRQVLAAATVPLRWDAGDMPVDVHTIVNASGELDQGLHHWDGEQLRLLRKDVARDSSFELSKGQEQARDAAFVVILSADAVRLTAERGERAYRAAQLAAGVALGRIYLAAARAGLDCRGLTFNDDVMAELLPTAPAGLLIAAIGTARR